ncbi:MAG: hypothetical protein DSM106950_16675 [Stigonema ocellatum SAG 48.90 = DSM 106950]|nr:hypothetical protein [Stigonema ocellatum SAG 48.90 = DSM 106950]
MPLADTAYFQMPATINALRRIASRITVRVIGDNSGASGTLIAKKDNSYLL